MESPTRPHTKQEKSFTSLPPSPRLVFLLVIRISYLLGHPTSLKRVIHHQRVAPLLGPAGSGTSNCVWIVDLLITLELWDELFASFIVSISLLFYKELMLNRLG